MMICAFKSCVFFYRSRLVRLDMLRLGCVLSGNETSQPFNHGVLQIYDLHFVLFCFSLWHHTRDRLYAFLLEKE